MVEMLVREFVPEKLVSDLDFSQLQRVNTKFHTDRGAARRREGDIIWRLPTRDGKGIFRYLLLEFQSRIDRWMAERALMYMCLLWRQVIDERKREAGAHLPPLLTLVLYNGRRPWKAATETQKLIALSTDSALWRWQPRGRYLLLDMSAFSGEELARRDSLAALLFRLEQPLMHRDLDEVRIRVSDWFRQHPDEERLRGLFVEMIRHAYHQLGVDIPESIDLLEMKMETNLYANCRALRQRTLAEGREEGKAEGLRQGEARGELKGKADALSCLLVERFGALSPSSRTRIQRARLVTLDRWFKRAIDAPDLRSVFGSSR